MDSQKQWVCGVCVNILLLFLCRGVFQSTSRPEMELVSPGLFITALHQPLLKRGWNIPIGLAQQLPSSLKMISPPYCPIAYTWPSFSPLSLYRDNFSIIAFGFTHTRVDLSPLYQVLTTWVFWCQNLEVSQMSHPASSALLFLSWVVMLEWYFSWISVCAVLFGWSLELFTGVLVMSGLQCCQRQKAGLFSV